MGNSDSIASADIYQERTDDTAIYKKIIRDSVAAVTVGDKCKDIEKFNRLSYLTLGLCGEAGELANKVKKLFRDEGMTISQIAKDALIAEAGDVAWYLAQFCRTLGVPLSVVLGRNINKLANRKVDDKLKGSGDDR